MQDLNLLYSFLLVIMALIWALMLASGKHLFDNRNFFIFLFGITVRFLFRFFLVISFHRDSPLSFGAADLLLDIFIGVATGLFFLSSFLDRWTFYSRDSLYRFFSRRLSVALLGILLFVLVYLLSPLRYDARTLRVIISLASFYELSLYFTTFLLLQPTFIKIARPVWRIVLTTALAFLQLAPFLYATGLLWVDNLALLQAVQSVVYAFGLGLMAAFLQDPERTLTVDRTLVEHGREALLSPMLRRLLLEKDRERRHVELQVYDPERYLESFRSGNWVQVLEPVALYLRQDLPETPVFLGEADPLEQVAVFRHYLPPGSQQMNTLEEPLRVPLPGLENTPTYLPREALGEVSLPDFLGHEQGALTLPVTVGPYLYLLWLPMSPTRSQDLLPWIRSIQKRLQQMLNYAYEYLYRRETHQLDQRLLQTVVDLVESEDLEQYLDKLCTALEGVFPHIALLTTAGTEIQILRRRGSSAEIWDTLQKTLDIFELRRLSTGPSQFHKVSGIEGSFAFTPIGEGLVLAVYQPPSPTFSFRDQIRQEYFFSQVQPLLEKNLRGALQFFRRQRAYWFAQHLSESVPQDLGALGLREIARRILQTSLQLTEYPAVSLLLVDRENPHRLEYIATVPEHLSPNLGTFFDLRLSPTLLSASATSKPMNTQFEESDLLAREFGFRSWAVFPLHLETTTLGFLVFHSQQPQPPLPPHEIRILEQFSHLVSFILFWAVTRHEQKEQEQGAQKLLDALTQLLSITNEDHLQQKLVDLAMDLLEGDAASFMMYNAQERVFVITAARGLSQEYVEHQRIPGERVRQLMATGYAPLYIRNLQEQSYGDRELIRHEDLRSVLSVFVRRSGEVYGILNVYSKGEPRAFSGTKRDLFSYLALLASSLLGNIYLYHSALRQSKILETLNALGRQVIEHIHSPETSWASLLRMLTDLLNCRTVRLIRYREDGWTQVYSLHRRTSEYREDFLSVEDFQEQFPDLPSFREIELTGVSVLNHEYVLYLTREDNHAWILLLEEPLFEVFQEAYMDILQGISDLLSLGILGIEHFQNERRRSEDIAFVNQMLRLAFATQDFDKTLQQSLESLVQRLRARWIALVDPRRGPEDQPFRAVVPEAQAKEAEIALKKYRDRLLRCLRRQKLDTIAEGEALYLVVPLTAREGSQGVLFLQTSFREFDPTYTPSFLNTLASELAAVLENYELLQATREHARRLEQAHQQLLESSKLAALGSLAAGVAHEIKNPLFIIQGTLEMWARRQELTLPTQDMAKLKDAIQRINRIVRSLLDYARSSQETTVEPVFVNEAIERSLDMMIPAFKKEGITVETDFQPDIPPIKANRGEIQQIVTNLVQNARDAILSSDKGSRIVVSTAFHDDTLEISVWDNGPGIPEELREKIFDPFFTTKPPGEGTGLGLAIVQRIVRNMKGTVEVESQEGQYTQFVVRIPYVAPEFGPRKVQKVPTEDREALKGQRILVVDDEEAITSIIKEYLENLGAKVIAFNDPLKARYRARSDRFDAVILDIRMPEMSGFELYEEIQEHNPYNACRTLFLTGGIGAPEIRNYLEKHQLPFVSKPVELDELRRRILQVIRQCKESES